MNTAGSETRESAILTLERLKALTDGVVAIVVTLLVLGIEVPEDHDFTTEGLLAFLGQTEYELTIYAVSFVLISGYWLQHNVMFHYFRYTTRSLTWMNLLFLFFLTLLPFTTQLIGDYRYEPRVLVIYGVVNIACSLSLALMWWASNRVMPVVWPRMNSACATSILRRTLLGALLSVVAIGVAYVNVRASHVCFLLIPFLQFSHRRADTDWSELQTENSG